MRNEIIAFSAGFVIGGAAAWIFVHKSCAAKADCEINEMREKFDEWKSRYGEIVERAKNKPDLSELQKARNLAQEHRYSKEEPPAEAAPVYTPDEEPDETIDYEFIDSGDFASLNGYDKVDLTLYADGVLANETDEVVEVAETIGYEGLEAVKHTPDDAVYIRNNSNLVDYEVVLDPRDYSTVTGIFYKEYTE